MIKLRRSRVEQPPEVCPLGECMRLISGAWSPHVIWYLRSGPRRFSELRGDIKGVSAKVLTTRLRQLERDGVVVRREIDSSPPTVEYSLSELGAKLEPAIAAIVDVGHRLKQRR
ncbi:transcriptional regulator [Solimonas sp. K1W22B-7]|uniref:winged helix-turn-helix transcriptional regulator n=1 Tax=Solimonas sp. K1W22B-7 TaxID=2303331 RepID=UPI000E32D9B3|nr:helix-turn-helix domain-containing protein [Solimonas sp. K1W22B-7]AXQ28678.1 transcriptional regulator [Solimonas sp. K1W22B-7]